VRAVLELLSAVMQDTRFIDVYNERVAEGRPTNMDPWLDEIENRGIEKGRIKTVINTLTRYIRRQLPISADVLADVAEDNEMTVEKVRTIAKDNGISLS